MIQRLTKHLHLIVIIGIIGVASFLRLYRLGELTEFLGDQGSAGVMIYEAWKSKTLPLVGPRFSTGQETGPAFYYLIAPALILSGFKPIAAALVMVISGVGTVFLLYRTVSIISGSNAGLVAAWLYAVSPVTVAVSRNIWNPTTIPFFLSLVLYSMAKIARERAYGYAAVLGGSVGILLQLHYTNLFTLLVAVIFWIYIGYRRDTEDSLSVWIGRSAAALAALLTVLSPYLWYEYLHGFTDISSVFQTLMGTGGLAGFAFRVNPDIAGVINGTVGAVTPLPAGIWIPLLGGILIMTLLWGSRWQKMIIVWLLGGIGVMLLYRENIRDHYLYFLQVLSFAVIASVLGSNLRKWTAAGLVLALGTGIFSLTRTDIFRKEFSDIRRTEAAVNSMVQYAGGKPFSFTVIRSRSFSDFHYRYFFTLRRLRPVEITNPDYSLLFIVCEDPLCPELADLASVSRLYVLCYDHHCGLDYPVINLNDWRPAGVTEVSNRYIYRFLR